MPNLNEYLGGIVSSITNARAICDLQTVSLAKEYATHSLLQHFSVPRMRIEDVEMTIPIAIDAIDFSRKKYLGMDNRKHSAMVYQSLLVATGFQEFNEEFSVALRKVIGESIKENDQKWHIEQDAAAVVKVAENLVNRFMDLINKYQIKTKKINIKMLINKIVELLSREDTADDNGTIDNINVIIEANRLREIRPECLIYIKMKIREDGMEWAISENNKGEIESRLLPE